MGFLSSQVASAAGAAFWPNPVGKKVVEVASAGAGPAELPYDTGIILAPTPASWAMFPWRFDALEIAQNQLLAAKVYAGHLVFSDIVGTPDARFGTGQGNPGYQANATATKAQSFNYNLANDGSIELLLNNTASRPIEILPTGEIRLWFNHTQHPAYAKGVLTVGPEVILPFSPFLTP